MALRPYLQHAPVLGERVFVDDSAVVIGDVQLGDDSSIWPLVSARGDMHRIRIGERTNIQDNTVLHVTHAGPFTTEGWPLIIGDDCTIGHSVVLHGCTVGNRVLVGMGAVVMDGVVIEDEVIVGAQSLVPPGKRLVSGFVYTGSPAKQARPISDKEREFFTYSSRNYVRVKDVHLADQQRTAR